MVVVVQLIILVDGVEHLGHVVEVVRDLADN